MIRNFCISHASKICMNKLQNIISFALRWVMLYVNVGAVERTKNIFYPSQYMANAPIYTDIERV